MRGRPFKLWVGLVALLLLAQTLMPAKSFAASSPLYVRQINITGDEFITLQANQAIGDLSNYWLGYVNDNTATAAPSQQLPAIHLDVNQVITLSNSPVQVCDSSYVADLSFSSFSNSKGAVALWQQNGTSFNELKNISWGSSASSPAPSIKIASESNISPTPLNAVWYNDGIDNWVVGDLQNCSLQNVIDQNSPGLPQPPVYWIPGAAPPVTIASFSSSTKNSSTIPGADIGLAAPRITELLPNPAGTGTDNTDEFIELYNSNDKVFDLSAFVLETGLSTKHKYTFAAGTQIAPRSYAAFYSEDTGLTLSNSGSQALLLDPLGNIISQSDPYPSAKDGQAWVLGNGKWQWTSSPTPAGQNKITRTSAATGTKPSPSSTGTVKAASSSTPSNNGLSSTSGQKTEPIHPWTLAAVAAIALLYGAYEYRNDLAGALHRFGRYREARRAAGQALIGWPAAGISSRLGRRQDHARTRPSPRGKKRGPRK